MVDGLSRAKDSKVNDKTTWQYCTYLAAHNYLAVSPKAVQTAPMVVPPNVKSLIRLALEEDLGRGDLTALAVPETAKARAKILARRPTVLAGSWLLPEIAMEAGAKVSFEFHAKEGELLNANQNFVTITGSARELLSLERTWLNFLQRSCGIATLARHYREAIGETKIKITDTRKTLPGFRYLDKLAVKIGGLYNHRFGLDGGILVKENHIRAAGNIEKAIKGLQSQVPHGLKIQVEVTNQAEAMEALKFGAEALLLDNFAVSDLKKVVPVLKQNYPSVLLEASGGITLENIREYSQTGIDLISVGALTHSVQAADLSLLFEAL